MIALFALAACVDASTPDFAAAPAAGARALEEYAFTTAGPDDERQGIRTDAVLIVRGGKVIFERYARGWDAGKAHLTWSVSKTALNAVLGAAVARGLVSLDDSICKSVPGLPADHCAIQLRHLLEFSSGLDWKESYEGEALQASSVLAMLYGVGRRDMVKFVAGHPLRDPPGATWAYSSGDSTLLAGALDAALRPTLGAGYAWQLVFDPIGARSAVWERDPRGAPVGSSYLYLSARDLGRLAYLFLRDGCWGAQRILPDGWVRDSVAVSAPIRKKALHRDPGEVQGRQIWLNRALDGDSEAGSKGSASQPAHERPWPHVPEDAYAARGHWGQSATVVPSLDTIVVRYGDDRDGEAFDFDRFLALALAVGR